MLIKLPSNLRVNILEKGQNWVGIKPSASLSPRNKTLVIVIKNYEQAVTKVKLHTRGKTPQSWESSTVVKKFINHLN